MSNFYILLRREFLIFINKINFYILFLFLFPIILFLFLVTPLLSIIQLDSLMNYKYQAFTSIFYVTTTFSAFVMPLLIIKRDKIDSKYFDNLFNINRLVYSLYILFFSVSFAYLQFTISFFISIPLLDVLVISNFIFFLILIFPSVILFSSLGILLSNFFINRESIIMLAIFLFIYQSFAIGTFIPIQYYSDNYQNFNEGYNLIYYLQKLFVQNLEGKSIIMGKPIIGIFVSVALFGLHIFFINKKNNSIK